MARVYAFIQMYNELTNGNLKRCLDNCKRWADEIIIYDDKSTDNSVAFAREYTDHIILGEENDWSRETFHKDLMLEYIHKMDKKPDWILWLDCDEILDRQGCYEISEFCEKNKDNDIDAFAFQQLNLWRGESYYRTDGLLYKESYDNSWGWFVRLWKYKPDLTMKKAVGADCRLFPINIRTIKAAPFHVIHYGFSDYLNVMRHIGVQNHSKQELIDCASGDIYVRFAKEGQEWAKNYVINGKGVPNMFINESSLTVKMVPNEWYPEENIPLFKSEEPKPFPWSELKTYAELLKNKIV